MITLLLSLVLWISLLGPAFSQTFIWSNGEPIGTITGTPGGPQFYWGMDGTTGTITQLGNTAFLWVQPPPMAEGPLLYLPPVPSIIAPPPMPFTESDLNARMRELATPDNPYCSKAFRRRGLC